MSHIYALLVGDNDHQCIIYKAKDHEQEDLLKSSLVLLSLMKW